jgi:hypothetical protein
MDRMMDEVGDEGAGPTRSRPAGPLVAAALWALGSVAAFTLLDPVIAAFLCIMGLTVVGAAFMGSGWVRSSTYEEREAERVRRRKAKWEAGAAARERDRARWEAHQARKAGQADR